MLKSEFDPSQVYNAIVYLRVSTKAQNERSPEQQLDEIKRRINASGYKWRITKEYRDEGISGRMLRQRSGYQAMMRDIKTGDIKIDLILVDTLERFGRVDDLQTIRKDLSEKHGVLVLTADSNFMDPTTSHGRALGFVESVRATEDGRVKAHNVLRGKRDAAIQKRWPGGPAPYGYQLQSVMKRVYGREEVDYCLLIPDPTTMWIVKYAFELAATKSWGGTRIAKELSTHPDLPQDFKVIPSTTINYWLRNSIYVGDLVFAKNATGMVNDTRVVVPNPEEEIVRVNDFCEGIVSRDSWEKVQEIRKARSEKNRLARKTGSGENSKKIKAHGCGVALKNPLSGLVFCSVCGRRMRYSATRPFMKKSGELRGYDAYRCTAFNDGLCGNDKSIPANWLRKTVFDTLIAKMFLDPKAHSAASEKSTTNTDTETKKSRNKAEPLWLRELTEQVNKALREKNKNQPDISSILERERSVLSEKIAGWTMSLGNPKLSSNLRSSLEELWSQAVEQQQNIDGRLIELGSQVQDMDEVVSKSEVRERLSRLWEILPSDDAARCNLELGLHIDRITGYPNGDVKMRTCKLGLMSEVQKLLTSDTDIVKSLVSDGMQLARNRGRLKISHSDDFKVSPDTLEFATQTNRFADLDDRWFWIDEFQVPGRPVAWVDQYASAVFRRRQESKLSLGELAREFGVTRPTIKAAIKSYEESNPGIKDKVHLQCGGKRPEKFDLSAIGPEARKLLVQGVSKLKLAKRFGCSTPVIDRAIDWAYKQEGLLGPTFAERTAARVEQVRSLNDAGKTLTEICYIMDISDVTARKYLRQSERGSRIEGAVMDSKHDDLECA